MTTYEYPERSTWQEIVERPHLDVSQLASVVSGVLDDVRLNGDSAVKKYEEKFDHVALASLQVTEEEMAEAECLVDYALKKALEQAHANIAKFHSSQVFTCHPVETCSGVVCWQKSVPIQKVGLYIPGGTAPCSPQCLCLPLRQR